MNITATTLIAAALVAAPAGTPASAQAKPAPTGSELRLVVNIPAGRLHVYEGDRLTRTYPVSVGTRGHRTPAGRYSIGRVVWNPWWHPPEAEWARKRKVTPPGPGNPMGRTKIHLTEDYYIHGTPSSNEGRLGSPASHGCIRMRNADVMELARLVHRYDGQGITSAEVEKLAASPRATREVGLTGRVVAEIVYEVAEVRNGKLRVHPDVYGVAGAELRERVRQLLVRNGVKPEEVDPAVLGLVLSPARSSTREVPLAGLTARRQVSTAPAGSWTEPPLLGRLAAADAPPAGLERAK